MVMRVLHVAQPVEAGVAVVTAQLAAHQVQSGYDVAVACPPRGWLPGAVAAGGAWHLPWDAGREPGARVPAETLRLAGVVSRWRPDVVHLHSSKAGLAGRLALRGRRPTVFQPHAWSFSAVAGTVAAASAAWERFAVRWTHRLVCVSEAEQQAGVMAGVCASTSVVPNGVDLDRFTATTPAEQHAARRELGLPAEAPLAVCVGRLCPQKGQDLLLSAWPSVRTRQPNALLALVGDGPSGAALRAAAPPDVYFAGAVADPRPWYRAADVVVLPSRWEGMALVPLEAMACARPVIATDVTGVRESLPPDAPDAVVAPADVAALGTRIAEALADRDKAAAWGRAARSHVAARHDVRTAAEAVTRVYELVAGKGI